MLLVSHVHSDILQRDRIPEAELVDALPDALRNGGSFPVPFLVPEPGRPVSLDRIDWAEWQRLQGDLVDQQLRPRLDQNGDRPVAYFGATFIPLALDLGNRLGTFRKVHVFQHHHRDLHWRWTGTGQTVEVTTAGFPTSIDPTEGEVVVRVATSYAVSDSSVASLVPDTIADLRIGIAQPDVDALASVEDLDAVVHAFQHAMECILRNRPGTRRIHLFVSGPTGLAFRLGTAIPTSAPPIQTYQYDRDLRRHRAALVLPAPRRRGPEDRACLLLLSAQPSTTTPLKVGKEHDEIQRRLSVERFRLERRFATRVREIQELLDDMRPSFIHFAGHGDKGGNLHLEQDDGTSGPVSIDAFANLLGLLARGRIALDLLVLNACYSDRMAEAATQRGGARFAVGMTAPISDPAAVVFADAMYRALDKGHNLEAAFDFGTNAIQLNQPVAREATTPRLFCAPGEDPHTVLVPR